MSYHIHQTPGRIRMRMPAVKNSPDAAHHVRERLGALTGIQDVRTNITTGSVLVSFDTSERLAADIINALAKAGFLPGIVGFPKPMPHTLTIPPPPHSLAVSLATSPIARKVAQHAAKIFLAIIVERALGKTAGKMVSSFI